MGIEHFILENLVACYLASFIISMICIYIDNRFGITGYGLTPLGVAVLFSLIPVFNIFLIAAMLLNIISVLFTKLFKTNLYVKLNKKFMCDKA